MSVIGQSIVEVDLDACQRVADWIASKEIPKDTEETSLVGFSDIEIGDFYFFLVAICHQTTPIGFEPLYGVVAGKDRRGWDYLLRRFEEHVRGNRQLLSLDLWKDITGETIAAIFRDEKFGARLIECDRRAELIRNLAEVMQRNGWLHLNDLFAQSTGRVSKLVQLLSKFEAFRDPIHKKTFYLLALMKNNGIWKYVDPEQIGPPVDYHEVRGHLRLGTVSVVNEELQRKIANHEQANDFEDLAIRQAVFRAIIEISERSRICDPSRLHYLFWNVFRSCCQRAETHCDGCPESCSLPPRYIPLAMGTDGRGCPFRSVCEAAKIPERRKLIEHIVESSYDFH